MYIPLALKNYGLSLTTVSFVSFAATNLVGEMPSSVALAWAGISINKLGE